MNWIARDTLVQYSCVSRSPEPRLHTWSCVSGRVRPRSARTSAQALASTERDREPGRHTHTRHPSQHITPPTATLGDTVHSRSVEPRSRQPTATQPHTQPHFARGRARGDWSTHTGTQTHLHSWTRVKNTYH